MGENKIYLALVPTFIHSFTHSTMFSEHLLYTAYCTRHCGKLKNESEKAYTVHEGKKMKGRQS